MRDAGKTTGPISGLVINDQGDSLGEAVVMISGRSPNHQDIAAITREDGAFRFDDLLPGTYTITVNAEGYILYSKQIALAEDGVGLVKIILSPETY